MKTRKCISNANPKAALLIVVLLIAIAGCDDDPMAPCYDCPSTDDNGTFTRTTEQSFAVNEGSTVTVSSFVGKVTFRSGEPGIVQVRATRRARHRSDLDRVDLEMTAHQGGLDIETDNPDNLRNVSVDLEITAPPDARPRINLGVGDINYRGRPQGACNFASGVGSITLRLSADVNIMVQLSVGVGSIHLGLPVVGPVHNRPSIVEGRIGSGTEGSVHVGTGVGSIYLMQQ